MVRLTGHLHSQLKGFARSLVMLYCDCRLLTAVELHLEPWRLIIERCHLHAGTPGG
jgi:hypothetical protein